MKTAPVFVGKPAISDLKAKAGAAPRPLLTIDETAQRCHCSKRHVQNEIEQGHLRVIRLGRRCTRIDPADLDEYLNDRKTGGSRPIASEDRRST